MPLASCCFLGATMASLGMCVGGDRPLMLCGRSFIFNWALSNHRNLWWKVYKQFKNHHPDNYWKSICKWTNYMHQDEDLPDYVCAQISDEDLANYSDPEPLTNSRHHRMETFKWMCGGNYGSLNAHWADVKGLLSQADNEACDEVYFPDGTKFPASPENRVHARALWDDFLSDLQIECKQTSTMSP